MKLVQVNAKEFKKAVWKSYQKDFPKQERSSFRNLKKQEKEKNLQFILLKEQEKVLGYMVLTSNSNYTLLYYFAILREYRDSGYGGQAISLLKQQEQEKKAIYIEVEQRGYAKNGEENQRRKRRVLFYEANGFNEIGIVANIWGVEYELFQMTIQQLPEKQLQEEIITAENEIYLRLFGKKKKDKKVVIEKLQKKTFTS